MQIGTQVMRKTDNDVVVVGEIVRIDGARAEVRWPAPRRINGNGWRHSRIALRALLPATPELIAERTAAYKVKRAAHARWLEARDT